MVPGLGRSPGGGHDNPPRYSCLGNPHGQSSLVGFSPWGCKETDTAEQLSTAQHVVVLFPVLKEISILFSIVAVSAFILANSIGGFLFSTSTPTFIVRSFPMMPTLTAMTRYLIVALICIFLTMSEFEHLFISLLTRSVFTLEGIDT